jgi:protein-S-isoprenylcysteine O-methyltransferase Ste14
MTALPSLGRHGEGWFAVQVLLLVAIGLAGLAGPAWGGPPRVATLALGLALLALGGLQALRGLLDLGPNLTPFPRPRSDGELVERGIYGRVRHPIYGGLILGAFGWGLFMASVLAIAGACLLVAFFGLKSLREEAWLRERYPAYAAYARRTWRFLPRP